MKLAGKIERGRLLSLLLVVATAVSTIGSMSCSYSHSASSDAPKAYKTKTGKTIIISETHPVGRSLSTIEIRTKGFESDDAQIY